MEISFTFGEEGMEVDFLPGHAHEFDGLFDFGVSFGFGEHFLKDSGVDHEVMYLIILFYHYKTMPTVYINIQLF